MKHSIAFLMASAASVGVAQAETYLGEGGDRLEVEDSAVTWRTGDGIYQGELVPINIQNCWALTGDEGVFLNIFCPLTDESGVEPIFYSEGAYVLAED